MCEAKLRLCDDALQGRCRGISPVAADGGLYLGGDPMLEYLRLRQLGGENEGVEGRLVDDGLVWVSLNTVTNRYGILFPNWVVICHPILSSSSTCAFKAFIANAPQQRGRGLSPSCQQRTRYKANTTQQRGWG